MKTRRWSFSGIIICMVIIGAGILMGKHEVVYQVQEQSSVDNRKTTTIKFNYLFGENSAQDLTMKQIIKDFNHAQDHIVVEGTPGSSWDKQLIAAMNGDAPDVGHTYWPKGIQWAKNKGLEPLDLYIEKSKMDLTDFLEEALDKGMYNGIQYGLPFESNTMALYYNKEILREGGFSRYPETINELKEMAEELTKVNTEGEIQTFGFLPDYPWLDNVLWPIHFGAEFYDKDRKEITTTSPEYIQAIEFQNWFYERWGYDHIVRFKLSFGTAEQGPFYQGKLAMTMGGEWIIREAERFAPDLEYGICPIPYPDHRPDLKDRAMITSALMYISADSKNKGEAWEFIRFLCSERSMIQYAVQNKLLMSRKSVLKDLKVMDIPGLGFFADMALDKNLRGFPALPFVDEYLDSLTQQTELVFSQSADPLDAMKKVKDAIEPLLKAEEALQ